MRAALDMVAFPERDDGVSGERDHRRTGCQAVKAVGQVDRVRPRGHEEIHPDDEYDRGDHAAGEPEVEERLLNEAHACLSAGEPRFGGDDQREDRVDRGEDELADELGMHRQAQILFFAHLGEVVDEAEQAHRQHREQHKHRGQGGNRSRADVTVQCRRPPSEHDRQHDCYAAHGRGAALDQMRLRPVLTDVLPVVQPMHQMDQHRRARDGHQKRDQNAND